MYVRMYICMYYSVQSNIYIYIYIYIYILLSILNYNLIMCFDSKLESDNLISIEIFFPLRIP